MINSTTRHTIPVTCRVTGLEHEVADESIAVERADIRLPAICGTDLIPAPGDTPPRRRCGPCREIVTAPPEPPDPPRQPIDVADLLERAKEDPRVKDAVSLIPRQRDRAAHRRPGLFGRMVQRQPGSAA